MLKARATAVVKEVVHTAWWPPANDKFEEAVGVVSRGTLYMTGMMEPQPPATPLPLQPPRFNATRDIRLELEDIHDICVAGNTSLDSLVDCLLSVPAGAQLEATAAFNAALGGQNHAAGLTVLETLGEDPTIPSTLTCFAAVGSDHQPPVIHHDPSGLGTGVFVAGTVWATAAAPTWADGVAAIQRIVASASRGVIGSGDIVDCTAFLPASTSTTTLKEVRARLYNATSTAASAAAAVTVISTGLGGDYGIRLRCTATVGGHQTKRAFSGFGVRVVTSGGTAYLEGVGGPTGNLTDAYINMEKALVEVGSRMDLVLNCLYFMKVQSEIDAIFSGFYVAFNQNYPPPPSRTEFVGSAPLSCADPSSPCTAMAKCVAALPQGPLSD